MEKNGTPVDYQVDQFDRRFLDCWRRQAVVFMQKYGAPVDALFFDVFASTDEIFEQHILNQEPKYAFSTPALNGHGLDLIGWKQSVIRYDNFAAAKEKILDHFENVPFVILMGSVFYFPHCPEYLSQHLNHSIALLHCNKKKEWLIADDDAASVLSFYGYDEESVERFFVNNGSRSVRFFEPIRDVDAEDMRHQAVSECRKHLGGLEDNYKLLTEIEGVATCELESVQIRAKKIHEAFSLLSGSRQLFARFLLKYVNQPTLANHLHEIADEARVIKNAMIKAEIIGRIHVENLVSRSKKIEALERSFIEHFQRDVGFD